MARSPQRRSAMAAIWPPKATDSLSAVSSARRRPTSGMQSRSHSGSGSVRLSVGGAKPSRSASAVIASSTLPAAFTRWPSIDLVPLTQTLSAARPSARRMPARLDQVVLLRAGAVGVDVADFVGRQPRVAQRDGDQVGQGLALGVEPGDVMGLGQHLAAGQLGIDPCAASERVAEPFDDEHGRAFAHHESAAMPVERPAGLLRIVVLGQHAHLVEAGREQRMKSLGAAGQGDVALTVANGSHRRQDVDQIRWRRPSNGKSSGPRSANWLATVEQAVLGIHCCHQGTARGSIRWCRPRCSGT